MKAILLGGLLGRIPRPTPAMAVALLALLVAASGAAFAAGGFTASDGTITACRDNKTGVLRVIDAVTQSCGSKEMKIWWKDGINGTVSHAEQADSATSAANADTLDGKNASEFANAAHDHSGADITSGKVGEPFIDDAITRDSEVPSLVGDSFATQSALDEERSEREAADILVGSHTKQTRTALVTSLSNSTGERGGPRQTVARLTLNLPGDTQQALQQAVMLNASLMVGDSMGPEHGCPCEFSMDIFDATNHFQVGEVNQTFYGIDGEHANWTMSLTALNVAAFPGSRTYEVRAQVFDRAGTVDHSFSVPGRVSLISQTIPYKD
jgi:hypothetical protein